MIQGDAEAMGYALQYFVHADKSCSCILICPLLPHSKIYLSRSRTSIGRIAAGCQLMEGQRQEDGRRRRTRLRCGVDTRRAWLVWRRAARGIRKMSPRRQAKCPSPRSLVMIRRLARWDNPVGWGWRWSGAGSGCHLGFDDRGPDRVRDLEEDAVDGTVTVSPTEWAANSRRAPNSRPGTCR